MNKINFSFRSKNGELTKLGFNVKQEKNADGEVKYTGDDGALIQAFVDGVIARKTADLTAIQAEIETEEAKLNALTAGEVRDLDT